VDGWIPEVGCVTHVSFADWTLESEGKGKLKKLTCTGSGIFDDSGVVSVYRMKP
jgi:hypothetical protein